jgi:hypothetical protein
LRWGEGWWILDIHLKWIRGIHVLPDSRWRPVLGLCDAISLSVVGCMGESCLGAADDALSVFAEFGHVVGEWGFV